MIRKAHPEFAAIRKRSVTASLNAEQCKTLGYLKVKALETLVSDNPSLGQIILALQDLGKQMLCKVSIETVQLDLKQFYWAEYHLFL